MAKFNSHKWINKHKMTSAQVNEAQMIHGVDYSTLKLKSNIDQKWKTAQDIEDDLMGYFGAVVAANGFSADLHEMLGVLGSVMEDFDNQYSDQKGEPYLPRKSTQY